MHRYFLIYVNISTIVISFPFAFRHWENNSRKKQLLPDEIFYPSQWQIQDFPKRGGGANLLFGNFFAENCMEMIEIGPRKGQGCDTESICYFNVDVPINILNTQVYDLLNVKQHTQYVKCRM